MVIRIGENVEIIRVSNFEQVCILDGSIDLDMVVEFSENGLFIIVYGRGTGIEIYDPETGRLIGRQKPLSIKPTAINTKISLENLRVICAAVPYEKKMVVSGGNFSEIRIWDLVNEKIEKGVIVENIVEKIAVSDNVEYIAAYEGKYVNIYDSENMNKIGSVMDTCTEKIMFIRGTKVFATMTNAGIKFWGIEGGYFIGKIQAVNELFTDFAIDENGGSIFIATDKGNVIVYDLDVFDFRL